MKKCFLLSALTALVLTLAMSSCQRNSYVGFAHAAENSHELSADTVDGLTGEAEPATADDEEPDVDSDPLMDSESERAVEGLDTYMEVPDIPDEISAEQIMSKDTKKSAHRAEKLYSGQSVD